METEKSNLKRQKSATRAHRSSSDAKVAKVQIEKIEEEKQQAFENSTKKRELFLFDNTNREISDIVLANLLVLTVVFLSALIPVISIGLPILVFIVLETGLWGFVYNKEMGRQHCYEDIFVSIKKYIRIFCLFVVKSFIILFWSLFLIVPGVVCMLNYSFTGIILFESNDLDVKGALMLSKELTFGFRWQIFFFEILALASVCVAMTLMFFFIMFFDLFLFVPSGVYIVLVLLAGVLDFVALAMPLVQIAIVDTYIISKDRKTA